MGQRHVYSRQCRKYYCVVNSNVANTKHVLGKKITSIGENRKPLVALLSAVPISQLLVKEKREKSSAEMGEMSMEEEEELRNIFHLSKSGVTQL